MYLVPSRLLSHCIVQVYGNLVIDQSVLNHCQSVKLETL